MKILFKDGEKKTWLPTLGAVMVAATLAFVNASFTPGPRLRPEPEPLPARFPAEEISVGTYRELQEMADFAISRQYNAIQLLRDMAQNYARQGISVRFSGADIRELAKTYSLGNDVALALLPMKELDHIVVGSRGGKAQLAITLNTDEATTSFKYMFFSIQLRLSRVYGVYDIGDSLLSDVRGVTAVRPDGTAKVLALELGKGTDVHVRMDRKPYPTVTVAPITKRR